MDVALRAVNAWMGRGMPPEEMEIFGSQSFCPEHRSDPVFVDLLERTPALELVESALGKDAVLRGHRAQIALRFPLPAGSPKREPEPHLDGIATSTNGVTSGRVHHFAALLALYLEDVEEEWAGNFTVWPGTHTKHAAWFRAHGAESLLEGMPEIDRGAPKQLTARAGDVFFCHYLLGHTAAENHSPRIRYAVFFRLQHRDHAALGYAPMCEPWLGWRGMDR
jgi:ectoine hydroxylase-related dioxygenase (phytanoyl-CoA dioxygenase family)